MALQDSARLKLFVNGSPSTTHTSLSKTTEGGRTRIDLMESGLAGFNEGAGEVTIEIGYAIFISGPEFDYETMAATGEFVDMQFFQGRLSYSGRGKIMNAGASQATGSAAEGKASWVGEMKPHDG